MKKIISLILSVILVFSLVSVGASAADDNFTIAVATDLHYSADGVNSVPGRYADEDFSNAKLSGALTVESGAIIDAFLEAAAENEAEAVLLTGDLADRGLVEEEYAVSEKLKAFEETSGKQVYVVPGNHDYLKTTAEEFRAIYGQFGYDEAIAQDTLSASYVADIGDDFRLIAIDSGKNDMTAERVQWIKTQAEKAKAEGKKTIAMMHHNLVNHFMFGDILFEGAYIDPALGLAEIFAENGIKYNFTGHTHAQDIKSYTGKNGATVYDVLTSSVNAYPCSYRVVSFGEKTKIETRSITAIDAGCLKGIVTDNCYNLASTDFAQYAKICLDYGHAQVADTYLSSAKIKSILGLDSTEDEKMSTLIDELLPKAREIFYIPLYTADETEKGKSIESLAKKFNIILPDSDYNTFAEVFTAFYQGYTFGDENYGLFSDEYKIFVASVTVLLNEVLSNVSAEDYALVMAFICNYFGMDKMPSFFLNYAADGISRAKGIDILVSSVISTVILGFTTDEVPGDNNVTLDGYEEEVVPESELTFFEKLTRFFISIFDLILRFFGAGK